jgi:hypothetical protein
MSNYYTNEEIIDTFEEVRFQTGLSQVNFIITLVHNGVISSVPVTLTEVGLGLYSIAFEPDAQGTWSLSVRVTNYPQARYHRSYSVSNEIKKEILEANIADYIAPGNMADYINRVKKYTSNRVLINSGQYEVKEDDGVTTFEEGIVNTAERTPF